MYRHWPIGLLYDYHSVLPTCSEVPAWDGLPGASSSARAPFAVTLHIKDPPNDKLLLSPSQAACKETFMHMLKVRERPCLRQDGQQNSWTGSGAAR